MALDTRDSEHAAASAAGVASESAQGQLTTSTVTITCSARVGSIHHHTSPDTAASVSNTSTKTEATRSAMTPWVYG